MDWLQPGPQRTDPNWYISGYKSPYGGYALSYVDWVKLIVGRYKNEPKLWLDFDE